MISSFSNNRYDKHALQVRLPDDEFTRSTTQALVGALESVAVVFQAVVLGFSATVDPYTPSGRLVVLGLALAHLVAAYWISRTAGPFARGGWWVTIWIGLAFLMPALGAALIEPGSYAAHSGSMPLNIYPNGPVLIAAFYPWISAERRILRWSFETLLLLLLAVEPFILVDIFNPNPQWVSYINAATTFMWVITAYVLGKSVGHMCKVAARQQLEIQQQSYDEFFNFLHSHVKAGVAAIKAEWGHDAAMREKLVELEHAVSDRRVELLLARRQVPLAALISERIRAFAGVLDIKESPRVGALTVSRSVGLLINRALGDLLKNVALYGGNSVVVRIDLDESGVALEVIDGGPGFEPLLLNDESKSLCRLRRDAEHLGGSLTVTHAEPSGAHVRLFVPMPLTLNKEIRHARATR